MTAIYVHTPFCKQKCNYCDFNSYPGLESIYDAYVSALAEEIVLKSESRGPGRIRSVYFGGGTPVLLGPGRLASIIGSLKDGFEIEPGAEITIEANPEAVSYDSMSALKELGVNRVSIGFQSLDDECLQVLGRRHTASKAIASFLEIRQAGFDNINIDLIFGVPTQSLASWALNLEQAAALNPEHISCYALSVEANTPLYKMIELGAVELPDEEIQADMMTYTRESLMDSEYEHYEISNFAKSGRSCSHNLTYWNNDDYLGFGAGAHSKIEGVRYANIRDPNAYIEALKNGDFASLIEDEKVLSIEEQIGDAIFLGLRKTKGIDVAEFNERYGCDIFNTYAKEIEELVESGLLLVVNDTLRLSGRGILLGNEVFSRFI